MYSFPIWNQSVVPCPVLTVTSWPANRFLKRQVRWSGIPISWRIFQFFVIHTVKGFGIVYKAEVDDFLELFCFFHDPEYVGNLISGSSDFSKKSLNIWKFTVHVYWKMMLWKCCTQYASKFGKLSSGHRTGKGPFPFQSQRKAMPKNAQTTAQLQSSHTLVK